jgi:hypothetical protein
MVVQTIIPAAWEVEVGESQSKTDSMQKAAFPEKEAKSKKG